MKWTNLLKDTTTEGPPDEADNINTHIELAPCVMHNNQKAHYHTKITPIYNDGNGHDNCNKYACSEWRL